MATELEGFSPGEICAYVKDQIPSISNEILDRIKEHEIDGSVFLELNDEYLREIAPRLGDRLKLKRIITRTKALNASPVSSIFLMLLYCVTPCKRVPAQLQAHPGHRQLVRRLFHLLSRVALARLDSLLPKIVLF